MRWLLAVILLVGCGERRASMKVALGGAVSAGAGALLLRSLEGEEEVPPGLVVTGALLFFGGALTAVLWGADAIIAGEPHEAKPPVAPIAHPGRARARALMIDAAAAARRDDCKVVHTADVAVRDLDEEFHEVVFVRDVAIARCLAVR